MESLVELERIMLQLAEMLREQQQTYSREMEHQRGHFTRFMEHHAEQMAQVQDLLVRSESRIDATNAMVQKLSEACSELSATCRNIKESYQKEFETVQQQNGILVEEIRRLREEKEAYYEAVKAQREELRQERERYDNAVGSMVASLCDRRQPAPYVNIDQTGH